MVTNPPLPAHEWAQIFLTPRIHEWSQIYDHSCVRGLDCVGWGCQDDKMVYKQTKMVVLPASRLWRALAEMGQWLPTLDTVVSVELRDERPFLTRGHAYDVRTPEGITMHALVTHVDPQRMTVRIHVHAGPLRSRLTCHITAINERRCTITRIQAYPGLVGR